MYAAFQNSGKNIRIAQSIVTSPFQQLPLVQCVPITHSEWHHFRFGPFYPLNLIKILWWENWLRCRIASTRETTYYRRSKVPLVDGCDWGLQMSSFFFIHPFIQCDTIVQTIIISIVYDKIYWPCDCRQTYKRLWRECEWEREGEKEEEKESEKKKKR